MHDAPVDAVVPSPKLAEKTFNEKTLEALRCLSKLRSFLVCVC